MQSLNPLNLSRMSVQVLDVSRQGLKLRIAQHVLTGSEIQVELKDLFVLGLIRYCVQVGSFFLVGILVEDVLQLRHVH